MKCKRCGNEMKREKRADHSYIYMCPKCGLKITREAPETNEYQEAYNIITGQNE